MTQPRKSPRYVPEVSILRRDAELCAYELSDPDRLRDRDLARSELFQLYRQAKQEGALADLDPSVRHFCEEDLAANGGKLPKARLKAGRPSDEHQRLRLWLRVYKAIARGVRVGAAIEQAAQDPPKSTHDSPPPVSIKHVRDIWYRKVGPNEDKDRRLTLALNGLAALPKAKRGRPRKAAPG